MSRVICPAPSDDASQVARRRETFARDVKAGLSAEQKYIPAAYHYDAEGSRLFNKITELPEYYLTRCEIDALESNKEQIAATLDGSATNLIEFGPGDGSKTRTLISYFHEQGLDVRYVAVDISRAALEELDGDYQRRFPDLPVHCLLADYASSLQWLNDHCRQKNLVLFLGSSIGNFRTDEARSFLLNLKRDLTGDDRLIIGFDLDKEADLIHNAYNDSENVTADFNLNILERINRDLEGDFDTSKFRYEGRYESKARVVKSYLVSLEDQHVAIDALGCNFHFREGEAIHTEDSYKYRESDIEHLAAETGFEVTTHLYDARRYFVDSVWEVAKGC